MNSAAVSEIKVIRKYSIRRILAEKEKWEALRLKGLLLDAWDVGESRYLKILAATTDSSTSMTADQLMAASRVLDVEPEDIMEEFPEPEDFRL